MNQGAKFSVTLIAGLTLVTMLAVPTHQAAFADYSEPAETGYFDPASGTFGGVTRQVGCRPLGVPR